MSCSPINPSSKNANFCNSHSEDKRLGDKRKRRDRKIKIPFNKGSEFETNSSLIKKVGFSANPEGILIEGSCCDAIEFNEAKKDIIEDPGESYLQLKKDDNPSSQFDESAIKAEGYYSYAYDLFINNRFLASRQTAVDGLNQKCTNQKIIENLKNLIEKCDEVIKQRFIESFLFKSVSLSNLPIKDEENKDFENVLNEIEDISFYDKNLNLLSTAFITKHFDEAKALIKKGANINIKIDNTPLFCFAIQNQRMDIAELLIEKKINKFERFEETSVLEFAARINNLQAVKLLLNDNLLNDNLFFSESNISNAMKIAKGNKNEDMIFCLENYLTVRSNKYLKSPELPLKKF